MHLEKKDYKILTSGGLKGTCSPKLKPKIELHISILHNKGESIMGIQAPPAGKTQACSLCV